MSLYLPQEAGWCLSCLHACIKHFSMLCRGLQELVLETDKLGSGSHNDHPLSQSDDSIWRVYFQVSSFV